MRVCIHSILFNVFSSLVRGHPVRRVVEVQSTMQQMMKKKTAEDELEAKVWSD